MDETREEGRPRPGSGRDWRQEFRNSLIFRREILTFLPALGLAGLWYGWHGMVLVAAAAAAVGWIARRDFAPAAPMPEARDSVTGLILRPAAAALLAEHLHAAEHAGHTVAAMVVGLAEPEDLQHEGREALEAVLRVSAERLASILRETDAVGRLEGSRFALVLKPTVRTDLESTIQLAGRLQTALEQPISINRRTLYLSAHVGFCLSPRAPARGAEALLAAAETACDEAGQLGPSTVRAYSSELQRVHVARGTLSREIEGALGDGQIAPWFIPQLSTDTGEVTGFQAVPRWVHPARGVLGEAEIRSALGNEGLRERLAEVVLFGAFAALREWDLASLRIGTVSFELPSELLANPKLPDRLRWELDRFEVGAERLRIVLPPSVAPLIDTEVGAHNVARLAETGICIELAGFGAGPASVTTVRRSGASRLRIHRSLVSHVDTDAEQQRLVAAIVSLAEGLGLETLADGVASIGEHAMVSQLGCNCVQGTGIAAAMPLAETVAWVGRHREKLRSTPRISSGRHA